jgi:hypothetical protein
MHSTKFFVDSLISQNYDRTNGNIIYDFVHTPVLLKQVTIEYFALDITKENVETIIFKSSDERINNVIFVPHTVQNHDPYYPYYIYGHTTQCLGLIKDNIVIQGVRFYTDTNLKDANESSSNPLKITDFQMLITINYEYLRKLDNILADKYEMPLINLIISYLL